MSILKYGKYIDIFFAEKWEKLLTFLQQKISMFFKRP